MFKNLLIATLLSISLTEAVQAESAPSLTVVVNGIRHKTGEICMRVYDSERDFPIMLKVKFKVVVLKLQVVL